MGRKSIGCINQKGFQLSKSHTSDTAQSVQGTQNYTIAELVSIQYTVYQA